MEKNIHFWRLVKIISKAYLFLLFTITVFVFLNLTGVTAIDWSFLIVPFTVLLSIGLLCLFGFGLVQCFTFLSK